MRVFEYRATKSVGRTPLQRSRRIGDDQLLSAVFEAQGQPLKQSCRLVRHRTLAEVVRRMLLLKHVRDWTYETLDHGERLAARGRSRCFSGGQPQLDHLIY